MYITKKIGLKLASLPYVKKAIEERTDLSSLKRTPDTRIIIGIFLVLFSYLIGWPAVGLLTIIAIYSGKPLIAVIGGPLIYGFSHVVFWVGMYLAGASYVGVFLRWAARTCVEKMIRGEKDKSASLP